MFYIASNINETNLMVTITETNLKAIIREHITATISCSHSQYHLDITSYITRQQWQTTVAAVATASFNGPTHKQASIGTNPNINESMKHLKLQTQVLKLYIQIQPSIQSWDPGSLGGPPWLLSSRESIHPLSVYGQLSLKHWFRFGLNGKIKQST